jgi:hypothetical protein
MNSIHWLIEILAGLVSGVVIAFLGAVVGGALSGNRGLESVAATLGGMLLGFPLGTGIAMGFVVYRLHRHPRPWLGVVGAIIGIALVVLLAEPTGLNRNTELLMSVAVITCLVSAWGALHLPRDVVDSDH